MRDTINNFLMTKQLKYFHPKMQQLDTEIAFYGWLDFLLNLYN